MQCQDANPRICAYQLDNLPLNYIPNPREHVFNNILIKIIVLNVRWKKPLLFTISPLLYIEYFHYLKVISLPLSLLPSKSGFVGGKKIQRKNM